VTETKPGQFLKFIDRLMDSKYVSSDYKPFIFPVQKGNKAPGTKISWKAEESRLSIPEARQRLAENYGNVGIAGRPSDRLILLDIDDPSIEDEIKDTLKIRSRSRSGTHAIYWADPEDDALPCNIPTDKGELRSSDQYVVAPGSYVPVTDQELEDKVQAGEITEQEKQDIQEDDFRGYYTIDNDKEIAEIKLEELPDVFQEHYEDSEDEDRHAEKEQYDAEKVQGDGNQSAVFDLEITDLTGRGLGERDPHPLHVSETGKNWSIGKDVGHCWRHQVSLNGLQFLCVESGYMTCLEAGTPHKNSSAGSSKVTGNDEAIWEAWLHAKKNGYIPEDDSVPIRAIHHIARKEGIADPDEYGDLDSSEWNRVLKAIEVNY